MERTAQFRVPLLVASRLLFSAADLASPISLVTHFPRSSLPVYGSRSRLPHRMFVDTTPGFRDPTTRTLYGSSTRGVSLCPGTESSVSFADRQKYASILCDGDSKMFFIDTICNWVIAEEWPRIKLGSSLWIISSISVGTDWSNLCRLYRLSLWECLFLH